QERGVPDELGDHRHRPADPLRLRALGDRPHQAEREGDDHASDERLERDEHAVPELRHEVRDVGPVPVHLAPPAPVTASIVDLERIPPRSTRSPPFSGAWPTRLLACRSSRRMRRVKMKANTKYRTSSSV